MLDCQPIISKSYNVGPGSNKTSKLGLFSNCYLQSTYLHCTLPAKVNSLNESFYPWAVPSTTSKVVVTFNLRLRNEFQPFLAKIKPPKKKFFFFENDSIFTNRLFDQLPCTRFRSFGLTMIISIIGESWEGRRLLSSWTIVFKRKKLPFPLQLL